MATVLTADTVFTSAHVETGLVCVEISVEVPTTNLDTIGDAILLYKFAPGDKLPIFLGQNVLSIWFDDMDTHATPTLDIDIGLADNVDAALDTTLYNSGGGGQAATAAGGVTCDDLETLANQGYIDCSGLYLSMWVIAAAATAAAGTVKITMLVAKGVLARTDDLT